jgi:hypothetical protein
MEAAIVDQDSVLVLDHVKAGGAGVFVRLLCGEYDILALGRVQVQLGVCKIFD